MDKIQFVNVLPRVFSAVSGSLESDVWQHEVTFERGRRYLIEADSGKGKSTLCSYILGYRHDYTGEVLFDGRDSRHYSIAEWSKLRRQTISCLFQELRLFPELTSYENVAIKNRLTHNKTRHQIEEWFERMGMADKLHVKVGLLSFGQQQRVALMRALVQPFDFLLADEPVSHLDDRNAQVMAEILSQEAAGQGACVIVTSIGKHLPLYYDFTLQL